MSELKHKMEFSLGDPSGDGHRYYDTFYIKSNYSADDISEIYYETCEKLGFDFVKEAAAEYEDRNLNSKYVAILIENNIITEECPLIVSEEKDSYYFGDEGSIYFDTAEDYIELFFKIIKWTKLDFEWEYTPYDGNILWALQGTGYGLFD